MTELSTHTRKELAHRSSDDMDVTLIWVQNDGEDEAVVCVCDRREGAYFEIPIEPYLADPTITEVMVNGPRQIYIERKGKISKVDVHFMNDDPASPDHNVPSQSNTAIFGDREVTAE